VKKTSAGADTYYFYNQAGQLMYQTGPTALTSTNFIYFGSKIVARDVDNAPTISAPALSNSGSFTVSWTAFAGATSYNLQERVNGGGWTTIQSGSATASAITGKSNGVYGYQVQVCNASTCTPWSNIASTIVLFPPATPATITVPATSTGSVAVSWSASATATSYTLQHRLGAGSWAMAYTGAATSASVSESVTGSYSYQVEACNAGGCSAFKLSSAVAVTRPPTSATVLSVPPTSYTGGYTVSWGAVTGSTSYTLQGQVNGGGWTTVLNSNVLSDAISGKGNGSYGYRVQGCNVAGCGPVSGTKTIVVTRVPAAPANISAPTSLVGPVGGSFTVSWAAVSGATSYTLQRTRAGTSLVTAVYSGSATSASDGGPVLVPGTYVYEVKACNVAGCSGWRNSAPLVIVSYCDDAQIAKPGEVKPDMPLPPPCGSSSVVGKGVQP
jgi:hypothetical protein